MSIGTLFLRNRPMLECMCYLLQHRQRNSSVKITVLGCSKGAEVYSMSFAIRSARPELDIAIHAVDISNEVIEVAKAGVYSLKGLGGLDWPDESLATTHGDLAWSTWQGQDVSVFACTDENEIAAMFDRVREDQVSVKARFRQGITWQVSDAQDPALLRSLGPQDMVVANNFLCHLKPAEASMCLSDIGRFVKPGGYLCVSGVDLDVRTRVALKLGWKPVQHLLREVHDGDTYVREAWPWNYCGLEPFDSSRRDWRIRYASVFQVGAAPEETNR